MNKYTDDGRFIIDASGKQWPVETWYEMPLPKGLEPNPSDQSWSQAIVCFWDHWYARAPLPPVPKPKTQEELDEDEFNRQHIKQFSMTERRVLLEFWNAAHAYARK